MKKWFNSLPRLVQMLLLLIPFVNWIVELLVRWSDVLDDHKLSSLVLALIVTIFGMVFGWLDFFWCLFFNHLIGAK